MEFIFPNEKGMCARLEVFFANFSRQVRRHRMQVSWGVFQAEGWRRGRPEGGAPEAGGRGVGVPEGVGPRPSGTCGPL